MLVAPLRLFRPDNRWYLSMSLAPLEQGWARNIPRYSHSLVAGHRGGKVVLRVAVEQSMPPPASRALRLFPCAA